MKLTKSGEIEACCDWVTEHFIDYELYEVILSKGDGTIARFCVKNDLDSPIMPISYCPNCGVKTEIEGK